MAYCAVFSYFLKKYVAFFLNYRFIKRIICTCCQPAPWEPGLAPASCSWQRSLRITHEPLIKTPVTSSVAAFLRLCCSCIFDHFLLEILSSHRLPLSALNPHAKPSPPTTECHPILISAWYTPPACLCFQTCSVRRLSFKPLSWKCSISFLSSCDSYLKYFWDAFFFFIDSMILCTFLIFPGR